MDWIKITAWVLTTLSIFVVHYFRGKKPMTQELDLADFINVGVSMASVVSSCGLLHLAVTSQELKNLLGTDIVTLVLGAVAIIWVSVQQIAKLFE